jgi:hypothetical protein
MIRNKVMILVIVLLMLFNLKLFSYISSRVSGNVMDKETNFVLENVNVFLMSYKSDIFFPMPVAQTKTNIKGYFQFDDLRKGAYFIECIKPGYATFSPDYYLQLPYPQKYINIFQMNEGQIKHFEIKMEKDGKLKVIINKKDDQGISGYGEVEFTLSAVIKDQHNDRNYYCDISRFTTSKDGICIIDGLNPGNYYSIWIKLQPFIDFDKDDILIEKNKTIEISKLYDFTDKTGISGSFIISDEQSIISLSIVLVDYKTDKYITSQQIIDGLNYSFRGIGQGLYRLYCIVTYKNGEIKKKEITVSVENGKTSIVDIIL